MELLDSYKEAKTLLRDAQRRMAEHGAATRHIVRLLEAECS